MLPVRDSPIEHPGVADEPLASEYPEAGAAARRARNGTMGDKV